jgi:hypothetical protein
MTELHAYLDDPAKESESWTAVEPYHCRSMIKAVELDTSTAPAWDWIKEVRLNLSKVFD